MSRLSEWKGGKSIGYSSNINQRNNLESHFDIGELQVEIEDENYVRKTTSRSAANKYTSKKNSGGMRPNLALKMKHKGTYESEKKHQDGSSHGYIGSGSGSAQMKEGSGGRNQSNKSTGAYGSHTSKESYDEFIQ